MLLLGTIGCTEALKADKKGGNWKTPLIGFLLAGLTVILLLTYSRGGWLAYNAGLAMVAFHSPSFRRVSLYCFLGFIIGVLLLPKGLERTRSMGDSSDHSITHRLEVWRGALAMTADHPVQGVGGGHFGEQFSAWYEPREMDTTYQAAVNNYLTLSAERGLFALAAYLTAFAVPLWTIVCYHRQRPSPLMFAVGAALIAYLASSCFTYSLDFWPVNLLAGTLWFVILVFIYIKKYLHRESFIVIWEKPLLTVAILVLLLFFAGQIALTTEPLRVGSFTFDALTDHENGMIVSPRHQIPTGVILYFHDQGEGTLDIARTILRPLAEERFAVVSLDYSPRARDALVEALALEKWEKKQTGWTGLPLYLCGDGQGGRIAILTACGPRPVNLAAAAVINPELVWPFPDLSPMRQMHHLTVPLLIIASCPNYNSSEIPPMLTHDQVDPPVRILSMPATDSPGPYLRHLTNFLRTRRPSNPSVSSPESAAPNRGPV